MPDENEIGLSANKGWSLKRRRFFLLGVALVLLFLFFSLPRNWRFFQERVVRYSASLPYQFSHLGVEERRRVRWGSAYTLSLAIDSIFRKKGIHDQVLVLMPPSAYFRAHGLAYHVPEPAVFYYYTGLRTTWVSSDLAYRANWYVRMQGRAMMIVPVKDPAAFRDSVEMFRKYPTEL